MLAIVVNVLIMLAGIQAWNSLSVRQYPQSENASVVIATPPLYQTSADVVRGFVTTAIERAIASTEGIDYIEVKSMLGALAGYRPAKVELSTNPRPGGHHCQGESGQE